jgi:hypothetical protein
LLEIKGSKKLNDGVTNSPPEISILTRIGLQKIRVFAHAVPLKNEEKV